MLFAPPEDEELEDELLEEELLEELLELVELVVVELADDAALLELELELELELDEEDELLEEVVLPPSATQLRIVPEESPPAP